MNFCFFNLGKASLWWPAVTLVRTRRDEEGTNKRISLYKRIWVEAI